FVMSLMEWISSTILFQPCKTSQDKQRSAKPLPSALQTSVVFIYSNASESHLDSAMLHRYRL
ncbi:MAG: hypothetical protein ACLRV1_15225, partial [Blautia sp.]